METFSALLGIYAGNSPVPGEFPAQRPVTRSFDVFFDLRLDKRLSNQSWGWWFETLPRPLWRHSDVWVQLFMLLLVICIAPNEIYSFWINLAWCPFINETSHVTVLISIPRNYVDDSNPRYNPHSDER